MASKALKSILRCTCKKVKRSTSSSGKPAWKLNTGEAAVEGAVLSCSSRGLYSLLLEVEEVAHSSRQRHLWHSPI